MVCEQSLFSIPEANTYLWLFGSSYILMSVRWCLHEVLIDISLMVRNVKFLCHTHVGHLYIPFRKMPIQITMPI